MSQHVVSTPLTLNAATGELRGGGKPIVTESIHSPQINGNQRDIKKTAAHFPPAAFFYKKNT